MPDDLAHLRAHSVDEKARRLRERLRLFYGMEAYWGSSDTDDLCGAVEDLLDELGH